MGDSDDEYDRRRGRDKFRRERSDYDRTRERDDRRRDDWSDRRRDSWDMQSRDRRRDYRDYDRGRRDRYSPPRHDMSPPMKRMRRDWDDGGYGPGYDMPGYGGPMHGPPQPWGHPMDMPMQHPNMMPPHSRLGMQGEVDQGHPQATMMTFKQFLGTQEDSIDDQEAIRKYNEYKVDFRRKQLEEFFVAHKEEEWFRSKFHPDECGLQKQEYLDATRKRFDVFMELLGTGWLDNVTVDLDKSDVITKLLDAAVIKIEGGTDHDLKILDQPEPIRTRTTSEGGAKGRKSESSSGAPGETDAGKKEEKTEESAEDKPPAEEGGKEPEVKEECKEGDKEAGKEGGKEQPSVQEGETPAEPEPQSSAEDKEQEHSIDVGEGSAEKEPSPPGFVPAGVEEAGAPVDKADQPAETTGKDEGQDPVQSAEQKEEKEEKEEKKEEEKETAEEKPPGTPPQTETPPQPETPSQPTPRPLHKTCSLFLRNIAPIITKAELVSMCKRFPGFLRVALSEPAPDRKFYRRGWITFDRSVNIKEICWNLQNIRLRDCELSPVVNRDLARRIRPVSGIVIHKQILRNDIRLAAKLVMILDTRSKLWQDQEEEKKDAEKEVNSPSFAMFTMSKNPLLKNITDFLVEETSAEEDELLGTGEEGEEKGSEVTPEVTLDRDEERLKVLDRLLLYLRIVHSIDYYTATEYPNEDEMPNRCGIMHGRGPVPTGRPVTQNDVEEWQSTFEQKISPLLAVKDNLSEEEAVKLGKKDPEVEVEKFVKANTQEISKDKWLCPISGKKFKGPEFVRKHIFNKHAEKVESVKKECVFFNNYILDPKRPQIPEPQTSKPPPLMGPGAAGGGVPPMYQGPPGGFMYGQPRPPMYEGPGFMPPYGRGGFDGYGRGGGGYGHKPRGRGRSDPRSIIEYRDLDAPDDMDYF
ncbi:PREDICTED: serrate RNA effector molecule homolog [Branchiostoma belcheri]|uniref:Serrate RNA effector molecule homolog n=1 Tax=Branchiostoma belcheri TaxID=7741 RepID=A0A6P4YNN7_BRABE|nr:PREDICTED: serrate RNA effector molecule homolog [Branchiostoma belcheri]